MQFKICLDKVFVRIDKGEEIVSSLMSVCKSLSVRLAFVNAIGAVNSFTVGVYKVKEKTYVPHTYEGTYEIVSLTGSVTQKHNEPYLHLHFSACDEDNVVIGGHLTSATVSATCEAILFLSEGEVEREYDDDTGLNLFKF